MGKFDITAAFQAAVGNVSKSDTNRETIEYIGLELIDDDPANFYRVDGLEELAAKFRFSPRQIAAACAQAVAQVECVWVTPPIFGKAL